MYAERIAGIKSSAIGDILQLTTPKDMISFAGGVEFLRTGAQSHYRIGRGLPRRSGLRHGGIRIGDYHQVSESLSSH